MREMKNKWPEYLSYNVTNEMIEQVLDDIEVLTSTRCLPIDLVM